MKKTKRVTAIILSLVMLTILIPQTVLAAETNKNRYEEELGVRAIVKDAEIHVFTTKKAGKIELTRKNWGPTFSQGLGYREYTAKPADGWVWKGWTYEQLFNGKDLGNRTDLFGMRFSFSNNSFYWGAPYEKPNKTISVNRLLTTLETTWNKITYNIYANFNPTINATAGNGGSITDAGVKEVEYGDSKTYAITAAEGKEIDSLTVDGNIVPTKAGIGTFTYNFINVTEPHTINVTFKNKTHDVSYEFVSKTANTKLPESVNNLLPKASKVLYGTEVTAVKPSLLSVKEPDGVWTFKGYDKESQKVTTDVKFTGTWTFAKYASVINNAPTITANDKTITVGDKFDPLEGVKATDKEDGVIKDIKIMKNTVNPSKAGTYEVIYKVSDKKGASATKKIKVTVKEALKNNMPPKGSGKHKIKSKIKVIEKAKDNSQAKEKQAHVQNTVEKKELKKDVKALAAVNTGDNSNIMLFSIAALISFIGALMLRFYEKNKSE